MSSPPPVTISVNLLSGKPLEVHLRPTDTVGELLARVEQQLGESPLREVQLCVGHERLGAGEPVAELAARLAGGGGFVQALFRPSATKAMACLRSGCGKLPANCITGFDVAKDVAQEKLVIDVAKECCPALEVLLDLNVDATEENSREHGKPLNDLLNDARIFVEQVAIRRQNEKDQEGGGGRGGDAANALSCRRFVALAKLLEVSCVRAGRRQLDPDGRVFEILFRAPRAFDTWHSEQLNEVVAAAIRDPEWHQHIQTAWSDGHRDGGLRKAMEWLATEHSQDAVRAAAAEAIAAHLGPRAAETPPPAREAARDEMEAPLEEMAAEALAASDEMEVEQVAEAIEQSKAGAIYEEQRLLQEALLRSKEDLATGGIDVVLLQYNHRQKWLIDALLAAGCAQLRSGAMICVPRGDYEAVANFFDEEWDLTASHAVVAPDSESKIHSSVDAAKEALPRSQRRSTKVKDSAITVPKIASDLSVEPSEDIGEYEVVRTFVHVPIPSSMRSASSFQHPSV